MVASLFYEAISEVRSTLSRAGLRYARSSVGARTVSVPLMDEVFRRTFTITEEDGLICNKIIVICFRSSQDMQSAVVGRMFSPMGGLR